MFGSSLVVVVGMLNEFKFSFFIAYLLSLFLVLPFLEVLGAEGSESNSSLKSSCLFGNASCDTLPLADDLSAFII